MKSVPVHQKSVGSSFMSLWPVSQYQANQQYLASFISEIDVPSNTIMIADMKVK
jgi:hypothetical protein